VRNMAKNDLVLKAMTTAMGEFITESSEIQDSILSILDDSEVKEELKGIIIDYLGSDAGRKRIVEIIDDNDMFGEALDNTDISDLLAKMVIEKLEN